jgi:hypothetical protein
MRLIGHDSHKWCYKCHDYTSQRILEVSTFKEGTKIQHQCNVCNPPVVYKKAG